MPLSKHFKYINIQLLTLKGLFFIIFVLEDNKKYFYIDKNDAQSFNSTTQK